MKNFLKGIVIGLGAISPGLSGSVLLVIFGLYQRTINAISTLFKSFKENIKFLVPLALGMLIGVFAFSKVVDFLLNTYEMQTRFAFLGFIVGSVPIFYKEVKKKGFKNKYYILVAIALVGGLILFNLNKDLFPQISDPGIGQSIILGLVVAASYVIPGVDSAAILSAVGMLNVWVSSIANLDLGVLLYAAIGLVVGLLVVSFIINFLMEKCYTVTFSVIFGLFLSVIPSILNESCVIALDLRTFVSIIIMIICFMLSLLFGRMEKIKE